MLTDLSVAPAGLASCNLRLARLLVGTDFSAPAAMALKTAARLAQAFGSELLLVHASVTQTRAPVMEKLCKAIADEPALHNIRNKCLALEGDPALMIPRLAAEKNVDMILLGSHGAQGFERLLLGSTAEVILRNADRPVLIAGPMAASKTSPLRSVLFATDLNETTPAAARYAAALARRESGILTLLHVSEWMLDAEKRMAMEAAVTRQMLELIPPRIADFCQLKTLVAYGEAADEIVQSAIRSNASLIVLGRGRHGDMTDRLPWLTLGHVLRYAPCGVLSVGASGL